MKLSKIHFSALSSVLASIMLVACGGSAPEPETAATPPPPPPPAQTSTPVAQSTAAATVAPAPAAEPAPAPEKPKPMMVRMLASVLVDMKLTAEQKPTIDAVMADMTKADEPPMDLRGALTSDIADGLGAGKIDKAKTGKDIKALVANADESTAKIQDAANRMHAALTPEQRKQLADGMAARHEEMKKKMEEMMAGKGPEGAGPPGKGEMKPGAAEGHAGAPGQMKKDDDEGMHHGMMMGHMHAHLGEIAESLGLTPEQKDKLAKKVEGEKKAEEGKMKAHMAEMDKKSKAIGDAFQKDKFDAKKVGIGAERSQMVKAMAEARVKFAEMVLSVITPEQRAKAAASLREHAAKMGEPVSAAPAAPEKDKKADKKEEKADKAEAKAEKKEEKAEAKAEKKEEKADKAEKKADKAEAKADKAEAKADKAEAKADKAEKKADKAEAKAADKKDEKKAK